MAIRVSPPPPADAPVSGEAAYSLLSAIDPDGPAEAVLLLRRTGVLLGSWTRGDVPVDVIRVMAATLVGSVEAMTEAMGCERPQTVTVSADRLQLFATGLDPNLFLMLVAPSTVKTQCLRDHSEQIAVRLRAASADPDLQGVGPASAAGRATPRPP